MKSRPSTTEIVDAIGTSMAMLFVGSLFLFIVAVTTHVIIVGVERGYGEQAASTLTVMGYVFCTFTLFLMLPSICTGIFEFADNVYFDGLIYTINKMGERLIFSEPVSYTPTNDFFTGSKTAKPLEKKTKYIQPYKAPATNFNNSGLMPYERRKPPRATFFCRRGEEYLTISGKYEEKWLNTWELKVWQAQKDRIKAIKDGLVDETPQTNPEPLEFTAK
jgi:hypothetical protein